MKYLFFAMLLTFSFFACHSKRILIPNNKPIFDITGIPYFKIPDVPSGYTPELVAARMIDGLGFRFYWATHGLRPNDLTYKVTLGSRSVAETIDHIYNLSSMLHEWVIVDEFPPRSGKDLDFEKIRAATLQNLLETSEKLKSGKIKLQFLKTKIPSGKELDFWYAINGPMSDALWHCGQIVTMRRANGNPFDPKVDVLMGIKNN